jgi:hypothetical protein
MEDSFGVRRRDTTKGPPLRVLSLGKKETLPTSDNPSADP